MRNQEHGVVAESTAVPKIASTQYSLYILMLTHLIATALVTKSMSKSKSKSKLLANKGPIITLDVSTITDCTDAEHKYSNSEF